MSVLAPPTGTQSIDRAAHLLVHVIQTSAPPTVGELAERSGLPKSTTSRLVAALVRQGLVEREPEGALVPGPVLGAYARREGSGPWLVALAGDALERLARGSGETANLGIATALSTEMLAQRDSNHFIGSTNWVGRRVPNHASVIGKVFLAEGAVPFPEPPLERLGPGTLTSPAALRRELEAVRARGFATAVDELEPGLWAVAAPVRGADGSVLAALSLSGPTVRLRDGLLDELGALTRAEAAALSHRIGYDDTERGAA